MGLHNEEFRGLYVSPGTVNIANCSRLRWAGNVAGTRQNVNACRTLVD